MKNNRIAHTLLSGTEISETDAARLTLETIEALGDSASGLSRTELMAQLRRVIREGVSAVKAAEHTVTLQVAAWSSVEVRKNLRPTTQRDLRHFVRRILRVEGAAELPLRGMRTSHCRRILKAAFGNSESSYQKGRAILHSIFSYGIRQEWCDTNPVSRIVVPRAKEKPIYPLTLQEVERLEEAVQEPKHRAMRFSLNLLLYSGVRPTEVARVKPEDVCLREKQLIIRPQTSKTGGGRTVTLKIPNHLQAKDCTIPRNWQRRWRALRRDAGFHSWIPDVCRHTFASYHANHFRNLPALQLEMGHRDVSLLRSRYTMPTLSGVARRYWG